MFGTDMILIQSLRLFYPTIFIYHEDIILNIIASFMFIIAGLIFVRGLQTNKIANRFSNINYVSLNKSKYIGNNQKPECCSCFFYSIKKDKDDSNDSADGGSAFEPDWTYWGNIVFIVASFCYLCTSSIRLYKEQLEDNDEDDNNNTNDNNNISHTKRIMHIAYLLHDILIISTPIIFLLSALCYLYGIRDGEIAHSSRHGTALYCFRSSIDYYYIATLIFLISMLTYILSNIQYYCSFDYKFTIFSASIMNVCSAISYLASGFQVRKHTTNSFWEDRHYSCCLNENDADKYI